MSNCLCILLVQNVQAAGSRQPGYRNNTQDDSQAFLQLDLLAVSCSPWREGYLNHCRHWTDAARYSLDQCQISKILYDACQCRQHSYAVTYISCIAVLHTVCGNWRLSYIMVNISTTVKNMARSRLKLLPHTKIHKHLKKSELFYKK